MAIRILLFLFLTTEVFSQTNDVFRIYFTDKNNSPFSLLQPGDFLSPKSIDRRNRYLIALDNRDLPLTPLYVDSVKNFSNVSVLARSKWMNTITISTDSLTLDSILNYSFVANAVRLKCGIFPGEIQKAENVFQKRFEDPADENYYGEAWNQIHLHNGELLHNEDFRGDGMTIAVLDAGFPGTNIDYAFQHLYSENRILGTYNFVSDITDVYTNTHIHGTLVLSTMASLLPFDHVGTAPEANYYFFVTEDADTETPLEEDNWVEAAEYADSAGVDLINTSLGYTTFDDSTLNHSYSDLDGNTTFITQGADIASSRGILVVVSAGNNGENSWFHIGAPGDADSVLTVGGVRPDRSYVDFSSKGPSVDGRVKPDVAAQGYQAAMIWPGAGGVTLGSGTSFSSPITCGMAACLWQAHPDKNNMQIIEAIKQSGSQYNLPDSLMGYGIPDFYLAHQLLSGSGEQPDFFYSNLFPNPFTSELFLDLFTDDETVFDIRITDVTGAEIFNSSLELLPHVKNRIQLRRNFEYLASGIYFIHIHSLNHSQTIKAEYIRQ